MKNRVRSRRVALFFLVAGFGMVAGPMTMAVAQTADEGSTLGVFDVSADANGIGFTFGNARRQPDPVAAGWLPHASSQFATGPAGRAVSSALWPGPLVAYAGTLAGLLGIPVPADVLANANYPVKAEAAASGGDRDEKAFGPMTAVVSSEEASARTALTDFSTPALVSAARVVTKSRSYLDAGRAISEAETIFEDVEIAGLLQIATVRTLARGITDGTEVVLEHDVTISGVTVQGHGASIKHDGLHVGDQTNPSPLDPAVEGINEGFAESGLQAFVTKPIQSQPTPGTGAVRSGSLVVIWNLGEGGDYAILELGGALAKVSATPGSSFGLGGDDLLGGSSFGSGDFGGSTFSTPTEFGSTGSFTAPTATGTGGDARPAVGSPQGVPLGFETVSAVSDRVPWGWMMIGIVGMFLVGMGLHGLRASALEAALLGTTCPLERGAS